MGIVSQVIFWTATLDLVARRRLEMVARRRLGFVPAAAGYDGTATAGYGGTATAGARGTATAGARGTATAGYDGTATAGDGGMLIIQRWNGKRYKFEVAEVGDGGLQPNVAYRLNADGQFVEAENA